MRRDPAPTEPGAVREEGLEALAAIANEHRIRILRALAEADEALPFSELRRRVGLRDTGQFNYHLTELLGRFVRETESGYTLGHAGERVVVAAADVPPAAATTLSETTVDGECPVCGETDCEKLVHVHLDGR
jgi:DNA-binding transcriptional ArsR family regulator